MANTCNPSQKPLRIVHPQRGTCGGHGAVSGSYLRVRDLGEDGGQTLRQQQSAPQQGLRWTYRLIPNHSLPLFLPAATLPPLSLCLSSSLFLSACLRWCRGEDRTTMALWWLMVTMVLTPSSHPQLSAALLLLCFAFPPLNTAGTPATHWHTPLQAAENCSTTMQGAKPAVVVH